MPSLCYNLKTEHEYLQTLNKEFVSACEKAGDTRTLSSQQLRELQIFQRSLEQKRDEFAEKIVNANWKKVWKDLMKMEFDVDHHSIKLFDEALLGFAFREKAIVSIMASARKALLPAVFGWPQIVDAVTGIHAVRTFNKSVKLQDKEILNPTDFKVFREALANALESEINKDPSNKDIVPVIVKGIHAAFGQGYVDEKREDMIRTWLEKESIRKSIFEHIKQYAEIGQRESDAHAMGAVIDFHVALELKLLNDMEIVQVQKLMRDKSFQENLVLGMVSFIQVEFAEEGETAVFVLETVNAIKALTVLPRREKK